MEEKVSKKHTGAVLHDLFREVFAVQAALSRLMDKVHEQTGLTTPQRKVMQLLDQGDMATVPDMASRLVVSRQSIQVVCNDLLSRGLVTFADNPRHKRSKLAALTEAGSQVYLQAQEMENRTIEQVLPEIELEEAVKVREILESIRKVLDRISNDP